VGFGVSGPAFKSPDDPRLSHHFRGAAKMVGRVSHPATSSNRSAAIGPAIVKLVAREAIGSADLTTLSPFCHNLCPDRRHWDAGRSEAIAHKGAAMISDVLSEAVSQISDYLDRMPNVYADVKGQLDSVRLLMNAVRLCLDTPPGVGDPETDAIWKAVADLNVRPVLDAVKNFYLMAHYGIRNDVPQV
jgi:hypothetical protein